jgi:GAF domain-containing protein
MSADPRDALATAAAALAGELDLDDVLASIVESARQFSGARYAALGVIGDGGGLERFVHAGMDEETVQRIGPYPSGLGVLGLLIRDPRVVRLDRISDHPASVGFPDHHPPMDTFLGAPVVMSGRVYGNLYLAEKEEAGSPTTTRPGSPSWPPRRAPRSRTPCCRIGCSPWPSSRSATASPATCTTGSSSRCSPSA